MCGLMTILCYGKRCDHAYWKKLPMNLVEVCAFAW